MGVGDRSSTQIKKQAFLLHAIFYTFWILNHMTILTSQNFKRKKKRPFEVLGIDWKLKQSTQAPPLITEDQPGSSEHVFCTCTTSSRGTSRLTDSADFTASVPSAHRMAQEQAQMLYHPSTCAQMETKTPFIILPRITSSHVLQKASAEWWEVL